MTKKTDRPQSCASLVLREAPRYPLLGKALAPQCLLASSEPTPKLPPSFQGEVPSARGPAHLPERATRASHGPLTPPRPPGWDPAWRPRIDPFPPGRGRAPLLRPSPPLAWSRDRYSRLDRLQPLRSTPIRPRSSSPKGRNTHTHP